MKKCSYYFLQYLAQDYCEAKTAIDECAGIGCYIPQCTDNEWETMQCWGSMDIVGVDTNGIKGEGTAFTFLARISRCENK